MTTGERIITAILTGGVLYMIIRPKAAIPQTSPPERTADRVMEYAGWLFKYGGEQGVDPALAAAIMTVESGGDPNAYGSAGEIGLMQILPSTAKWINNVEPAQLYDPATNIQTGTAYLRYCIDRKAGNVSAGICGYNYGPDRVKVVAGQIVAPEIVKAYARNVLSFVQLYKSRMVERFGHFYTNIF